MTYRDGFDKLGNQLPPPPATWKHRAIQRAGILVIVVCVFYLVWVR